ncbi:NAD(P)/FAD-dependent oxidoreductase [Glaciimonas sp. PCH181]|uniref:NAD(P)/FAD-dependent oxidoreductase n=1 Tax=Glaciimonas sp. PCH181 TaxID=2133943 RepID=UPI000D3B5A55|nr:FAD-dependent oxidoreductase [Glaciimonas sp. PCH181]PUA20342.1 FAD-dependent oxidoreductase [Glaciimonas sp. PCH181]
MPPIIIVGSGLAGYTFAREFRKLDTATRLTIVSRDCGSFYSKPMLSTALQQKKDPSALASFSAIQMAEQLDAEILPFSAVTELDPTGRTIEVNQQKREYQALVLALGADQRTSNLSGTGVDDIVSVNDLADYIRFHGLLRNVSRVAILGAGLIGCEFANDLAIHGIKVVLVDPAPWPLSRFLPEQAGQLMTDSLAGIGVQLRMGSAPVAVDRIDNGYRVSLRGGDVIDVGLVLSAIGLVPRTALAHAAGLNIGLGIVTDACLRTSAEHIYALGDCVEVETLLLPYVMPIMHCARALAKTLSGNLSPVTYPIMPVVVKTPALPTILAAPLEKGGTWEVSYPDGGLRALYHNVDHTLGGFALMGSCVHEKGVLSKQMVA